MIKIRQRQPEVAWFISLVHNKNLQNSTGCSVYPPRYLTLRLECLHYVSELYNILQMLTIYYMPNGVMVYRCVMNTMIWILSLQILLQAVGVFTRSNTQGGLSSH